MEDGYTIEQASKALGVSTKTVRNRIKSGMISATLVDGKYVVSLESIRHFPRKNQGKFQAEKSHSSTVPVELSYLEGLLTRNAQLEAQAQGLLEHKAARDELTKRVADLEAELTQVRSRGFWSRLFNR